MNSSPPPEHLFHYTSFAGFLAILQSGDLWATAIQYLNDAEELTECLDLARDIVRELLMNPKNEVERRVRDTLETNIDAQKGINIFQFSFSEASDLLSQWRAYCPQGIGICFSIDRAALHSIADFRLGRCIYDQKVKVEEVEPIISSEVSHLTTFFEGALGEGVDPTTLSSDWIERLLAVAPLSKNHNFSEEREWRLFSDAISVLDDRFSFHTSATCLVPHVCLHVAGDDGRVPITRVVIGPNPNPKLAMKSVALALQRHAGRGWRVDHSQIPFRNL